MAVIVSRPSYATWSALCALLAIACGCSLGSGEGELDGTLMIPGCEHDGAYSMDPDFFVADPLEDGIEIRVQRGSDWEVYSDGLSIYIEDAAALRDERLEQPIDLMLEPDVANLTLYLNATCPHGRDGAPVALTAASGTVTFHSVYAANASKKRVEISANLDTVVFRDEGDPDRSAVLSGYFRFLYTRGRPAQRFP